MYIKLRINNKKSNESADSYLLFNFVKNSYQQRRTFVITCELINLNLLTALQNEKIMTHQNG